MRSVDCGTSTHRWSLIISLAGVSLFSSIAVSCRSDAKLLRPGFPAFVPPYQSRNKIVLLVIAIACAPLGFAVVYFPWESFAISVRKPMAASKSRRQGCLYGCDECSST